jgi:branched-chain amino acid transport system ATP-binding protein
LITQQQRIHPIANAMDGQQMHFLHARGTVMRHTNVHIGFAQRLGDHVVVMDNGLVVHSGTMQTLSQDAQLQHDLLGLAL